MKKVFANLGVTLLIIFSSPIWIPLFIGYCAVYCMTWCFDNCDFEKRPD